MSPAAPSLVLGPYTLRERIGGGRTARIYRADASDGAVAVKLLAPDAVLDDPAAEARFRREIDALAAVRHGNVIELIDHGVDDELGPFLVTPLIDGVTLRALIARGRVEPAVAALAARELAAGLSALHAAGVVHRDVKPENVMIRGDGSLVLLDLGLAWGEGDTRYTEEGSVAGSVPYMAPEQIEARAVTPATDVWPLGVICYEWIAGARPFERERQSEEVAAILAGEHEPLMSADPRVQLELGAAVTRCLQGDPADRPADGAAAEALFRAVAGGDARVALRDPAAYSEAEAQVQATRLAAEARAAMSAGKPFHAVRLVDRALAHCPDRDDLVALAGEVGKVPARRRISRVVIAGAALAAALAVAAIAIAVWPGGGDDAGTEEARAAAAGDGDGDAGPEPEAFDPASLPNEGEEDRDALATLRPSLGDTLMPRDLFGDNAFEYLYDQHLTEEEKRDPHFQLRHAHALMCAYREDEGIAILDQLARERPDDSDVAWVRAVLSLRLGRWDEADERLTRVLELDPDHAGALRDRGRLRRYRGRTRDAFADLSRAVDVAPADHEATVELATIYREAGATKHALPLLLRLVDARPADADLRVDIALAHPDEQALPFLEEALRIDPRSTRAHRARCLLFDRQQAPGTYEVCSEARKHALSSDPEVLLASANALIRDGDLSRAHLELAGAVAVTREGRLAARKAEVEDQLGLASMAAASRRQACELGHRPSCERLAADSAGTP